MFYQTCIRWICAAVLVVFPLQHLRALAQMPMRVKVSVCATRVHQSWITASKCLFSSESYRESGQVEEPAPLARPLPLARAQGPTRCPERCEGPASHDGDLSEAFEITAQPSGTGMSPRCWAPGRAVLGLARSSTAGPARSPSGSWCPPCWVAAGDPRRAPRLADRARVAHPRPPPAPWAQVLGRGRLPMEGSGPCMTAMDWGRSSPHSRPCEPLWPPRHLEQRHPQVLYDVSSAERSRATACPLGAIGARFPQAGERPVPNRLRAAVLDRRDTRSPSRCSTATPPTPKPCAAQITRAARPGSDATQGITLVSGSVTGPTSARQSSDEVRTTPTGLGQPLRAPQIQEK